jgi:hypothetical protein
MDSLLGYVGTDVITGFTGIVTGQAEYIAGSPMVLLTPRVGEDGTLQDGKWFDVLRVEVDKSTRLFDFTPVVPLT